MAMQMSLGVKYNFLIHPLNSFLLVCCQPADYVYRVMRTAEHPEANEEKFS